MEDAARTVRVPEGERWAIVDARPRVGLGLAPLVVGIAVGRYTAPERGRWPALEGDPAAAVDPAPPRTREATVNLPLADNRGRPFTAEEWGGALDVFVSRFGGATLAEPGEGCWLDPNRRVLREPIRPVTVSFAPRRPDEFRCAVHDVGRRLGQEAMYVRLDETRTELIRMATARPGSYGPPGDLPGPAGRRPRAE